MAYAGGMKCTIFRASLAGLLAANLIAGCASKAEQSPANPGTTNEAFFLESVKPILERSCLRCHNGTTSPGRLNLTSKAAAFQIQKDGKSFILPGKPNESLLVTAVSRKGTHAKMMPQLPVSLTDDQIGILREWITDGAAWPAGKKGNLHPVANPENP